MKLYIAGICTSNYEEVCRIRPPYVLESFYYIKPWELEYIKHPACKSFLLDSGGFTFMMSSKKVDWDDYVTRYIKFINKYNIDLFFELDIDKVVGLERVERFRERIKNETGKDPIPVWHRSRGKEYFLKMIQDYKYVSIGGLVAKAIAKKEYPYLKWFVDRAHEQGCKIHALGYSPQNNAGLLGFDSCDSSTWVTAIKHGELPVFKGDSMGRIKRPRKFDVAKRDNILSFGLNEWVKYSRYLDK